MLSRLAVGVRVDGDGETQRKEHDLNLNLNLNLNCPLRIQHTPYMTPYETRSMRALAAYV